MPVLFKGLRISCLGIPIMNRSPVGHGYLAIVSVNRPYRVPDIRDALQYLVITVYVPIDAHCASADLRVRVYFFF